jgi:hypothetical protein
VCGAWHPPRPCVLSSPRSLSLVVAWPENLPLLAQVPHFSAPRAGLLAPCTRLRERTARCSAFVGPSTWRPRWGNERCSRGLWPWVRCACVAGLKLKMGRVIAPLQLGHLQITAATVLEQDDGQPQRTFGTARGLLIVPFALCAEKIPQSTFFRWHRCPRWLWFTRRRWQCFTRAPRHPRVSARRADRRRGRGTLLGTWRSRTRATLRDRGRTKLSMFSPGELEFAHEFDLDHPACHTCTTHAHTVAKPFCSTSSTRNRRKA